MLNREIWDGYHERKQRLNPIFQFGDGMVLGETLNPYKHDILLFLLLEVFYRELKDDDNRSKDDLLEITKEIISQLKLEASEQQINRIVDGVLFSGPSNLRQSFTGKYFDKSTGSFQDQRFRYLINDSNYNKKKLVYKISNQSQSIIFMSREILDELPIEFEQLYVIQLIKSGNLGSALKSIDMLMAKVKNDIYKEEEYRFNLKRTPKSVLYNSKEQKKRREDFEQGLEERKEKFLSMHRWLEKLENVNEENKFYASELEIRIAQSYKYNELLTNKVYENHALETKIRKNPRMLLSFKKRNNFKEDLWEKEILTGISSEEEFDIVLNSLFSPQQPIQFPIELIFADQELKEKHEEVNVEDEEDDDRIRFRKPEFDWESIISYWEPMFKELLITGSVKLSEVKNLSSWPKEAIELWVMFSTNKETVLGDRPPSHKDDCLLLLQKMMELHERYHELKHKVFYTTTESNSNNIECTGIIVSPYVLHIKSPGGL